MKLALLSLLVAIAPFLAGARLPGMPAVQYPTGSMINYDFQPSATAGIWSVSHTYGNASLNFTLGDVFSGSLYECNNPQPDTDGDDDLSDEAGCSLLAPLTESTRIGSMKATRSWYVVQVDVVESAGNASRMTIKGAYEDASSTPFIPGQSAGQSSVAKFGHNQSVTAETVIWTVGGTYTGFYDSPVQLDIASTSTEDDALTGTGAHTVTIQGLDANFEEIETTVTLDGQVTVTTGAVEFMRVNRAFVATRGDCYIATKTAACNNVGTISIKDGSNDIAEIVTTEGQTEMAVYTVPAGKTAYLKRVFASISNASNERGTARLYQIQEGGARRLVWQVTDISGVVTEDIDFYRSFPEKTMLFMTGEKTGAAGTIQFSGEFDILLVDNN